VVLEAKSGSSVVMPSGNLPEMIEHTATDVVPAPTRPRAEGLGFSDAPRGDVVQAALASVERYSEPRFAAAGLGLHRGEIGTRMRFSDMEIIGVGIDR
jgi:hypothetical protein